MAKKTAANKPPNADGDEKIRPNDYGVSPEVFVETWQRSQSVQQVADKLKMPKPIAHARASQYRNAGVKLKAMPRGGRRSLPVDELNKLIESIDKKLGVVHEPKPVGAKKDGRFPVTADVVNSVVEQVMKGVADGK